MKNLDLSEWDAITKAPWLIMLQQINCEVSQYVLHIHNHKLHKLHQYLYLVMNDLSMTSLCIIIFILAIMQLTSSFQMKSPSIAIQRRSNTLYSTENSDITTEHLDDTPKVWDPKKMPQPRKEFLAQKMDASWGRGKFREEVWKDRGNPENFWWEAYMPSEEEVEAAGAGYDFDDSKAWFEDQGLDFEKVQEEYVAEQKRVIEEMKNQTRPKFDPQEFEKLHAKYMAIQKEVFEYAFRAEDDILQAAKGQPSLDDEDTGIQYHLDKEF